MFPFRVSFEPGTPIYEQVVYAAKKAIVAGEMIPGERFPSVRILSQSLKINPNTAHKVVSQLVEDGLLEVHLGLGTVVARRQSFTEAERAHLLEDEVEHLVVEAKRLGLTLRDLTALIGSHWHQLSPAQTTKGRTS